MKMSASEESNQANEYDLGSLPQYDSGDLSELVRKFQQDNPGTSQEAIKSVIQNLSSHGTPRPNTGNLDQLAAVAGNPALNQLGQVHSTEPWLEILEQPKSKGIRFRYKCEGRSAGSIPGESSSNEHKTFPSVRINNFKGPAAIVVVSCVTKDETYRPHPHTLVGKECRKGVCTIKLKRSNVATFPNLGIQCVTKKEIKDSLKEREQIRVDPYGTGYYEGLSKLHLNIVRLCFQAFLPDEGGQYTRIVPPVVSHCIYDKKAVNDLVVCRLSKQSGYAKGGDEVFMLCEKVNKDDIQVRFFEEDDEEPIWESFADFSQSDVHRQFAIVFKTPAYKDQYITRPVEVNMQLFRPSDEGTSEPKLFQYIPNDPDPEGIDRKRKRRMNFQNFVQDNNPNTPAFSLLTDNIKEENDPNKNGSTVKEKLKAKATRSKKGGMAAFPRSDLPQYSMANMQTVGSNIKDPVGVGQMVQNPLTVSEVVVQTTPATTVLGNYHPALSMSSQTLTHMSTVPMLQVITPKVEGSQHAAAASAMVQGRDDSGDIMLDDLDVVQIMNKEQDGEEQMSMPSLSNLPSLPSFDMGSEYVKMTEANMGMLQSKLHTDSAPSASPRTSPSPPQNPPQSRSSPRSAGKKIKK